MMAAAKPLMPYGSAMVKAVYWVGVMSTPPAAPRAIALMRSVWSNLRSGHA